HHLPLSSGQVYAQTCRSRWRRRRKERSRQRQYFEPPVKSHHRPRRRRLPQGHIRHGAAAAQNTDPALPPPRVTSDAVKHVAAAAHLEDVRAERVGALPGDDHRRPRLVLRSWWPPSRPPPDHVAGAGLLPPIFGRKRV
ncbi:hypothetical protein V8G54_014189, partial [Vigna mungo]